MFFAGRAAFSCLLYEKPRPCTEHLFGYEFTALSQSREYGGVTCRGGPERVFDPVAADGARSRTRDLAFGRSGGDADWDTARVLAAMDATSDFYLDRVSQVRMPRRSQGRVAVLGDAWCCSAPLSGMGASLALSVAAPRREPGRVFAPSTWSCGPSPDPAWPRH
ncbi:FAD-dependent oxidoreductase [Streptomyces sp. NBC_00370]|uniref:FAD-dependent oxidoreductase n=1 Tax=Streptomyces sp. NBC_00370 TaxID=2975728 RepID=UPI002E2603FF